MRLILSCSLFLALAASAHADAVPRLNVQQSCREAQAVSVEGERHQSNENPAATYDACMQDESQAHDQLAQRWSKFKPASRQSCVAQGIRPSPSYVEILTCLEMNEDTGLPPRNMMTPGADPGAALGGTRPAGPPSPGGSRL
jgi:hypothetical protein